MSYAITALCTGCTACIKVCPVDAISGEKKNIHRIDPGLCIECAACGRVCPSSSVIDAQKKAVEKLKRSQWPKPIIDTGACYACENCVEACPTGALEMKDGHLALKENLAVLTHPKSCVSCGWCVKNCQFDAIQLEGCQ